MLPPPRKPDKPKPIASPYTLFCKFERPRVVQANPSLTSNEVGRALGVAWGKLSILQKAKFKQESQDEYSGMPAAGMASALPAAARVAPLKPKPKAAPIMRRQQVYGGIRVTEGATVRLTRSEARSGWAPQEVILIPTLTPTLALTLVLTPTPTPKPNPNATPNQLIVNVTRIRDGDTFDAVGACPMDAA